ncbi:hypothetical protein [Roseiflexus sp. RS-1]|jgi:hypothetical protein|uniref:hypothetical protein n=1 Tax=Roseiflexus sp. (strain RS-1) TaxID=357808 RepID=UPI0000D80206|nr:hypothetical protein [Roseiflexus sp. RS-1]ABQ88590.1 hypothetical protein RoseRS_0152 [Roseiflexus sp. RS-1]
MLLALWILPALITALACLFIYLEMVKHGADAARTQRWRDRFVPVLFFGIAISFVFYAVLARIEEDIAPLQANHTTSVPLPGRTLFVRHPRLIRADAIATTPPELVVWLKRDASAAPLTVTVELSSSSTLIFTDETGAPVVPPLTLTDDGDLRPQRLGMRFLEDDTGDLTTIEVAVRDTTGQSASGTIRIAHETQSAFCWRAFKNRFFGDAGVGLAIASAVFGVGWQVRNERRQTRQAQQSERIREIRDLFDRDLVEWHLAAETLKKEARRNWEDPARSELDKTLDNQRAQLTGVAMKEQVICLLRDAAEYYRAGDGRRLNAVLDLLKLAHPGVFRDVDKPLPLPAVDWQSVETTLRICAALLHYFQMDAREFIVAVLEMLASLPGDQKGRQYLVQAIRLPGNVSEDIREVTKLAFTDPRIRQRLVDQLPLTYKWPLFTPHSTNIVRSEPISDWLETNELSVNPFDPEELQSCREFWERIALPRNQQPAIIQARTPVVGNRFDCWIAALALSNELRKPTERCMPAPVALSDFDPATHGDMAHFIGRAAGERRCAALAQQPGLLLWLPEDEQVLLAEWMLWIGGSLPALRRLLRNNGLQDDVSGQIVLHRLNGLLSHAAPTTPDARTMLEWLTIRPPGIERTHLIVIDDVGDDRARQFARLIPDLQRAGIGCTLFTASAYPGGFGQSGSIRLRWSEQELLSLLDSAVAVSRGPVQHLLDLVELSDPSADEEGFVMDILKHARGSFARSLTIFRRALAHHLAVYLDQNDPAYRFLNENDFIAAVFDIR